MCLFVIQKEKDKNNKIDNKNNIYTSNIGEIDEINRIGTNNNNINRENNGADAVDTANIASIASATNTTNIYKADKMCFNNNKNAGNLRNSSTSAKLYNF